MTDSREMPKYRSHKEVWALRIASVDGRTLHFSDEGYAPIETEPGFFSRYMPVEGSYYVVYSDGYASLSPAKAFEEGYERI